MSLNFFKVTKPGNRVSELASRRMVSDGGQNLIVPEPIPVPQDISSKAESDKIEKWLHTPAGWVEGLTHSLNEQTGSLGPTKLYRYQVLFSNNVRDPLLFIHKSRQVGMSFSYSAKSLAKCHIHDDYRSIILSKDKDEADEKIKFAKELYETVPLGRRKRLVTDNKHCLEFESGPTRTRIISFAQKTPRGQGRNADVGLDEFAHYDLDRVIWTAALPIILRGIGQATVLSTGFGMENLFYDMAENKNNQYSDFTRFNIPWWLCPALCIDVERAIEEADAMTTEQRVEKFGTRKLKILYNNMDLGDFKEEMEILFSGRSDFYVTQTILFKCLFPTENEPDDEDVEDITFPIQAKHPTEKFGVFEELDDLLSAVHRQEVRPNLKIGFDVGRTSDVSAFTILEPCPVGDNLLLKFRYYQKLKNESITDQSSFIKNRILDALPLSEINIDSTGLGVGIVDWLKEEYDERVKGTVFSEGWKAEIVPNVKFRIETQLIAIPQIGEITSQFYAIRRIPSKGITNFIYDVKGKSSGNPNKAGKGHHGDIFWSIALACDLVGPVLIEQNDLVVSKNSSNIVIPRRKILDPDFINRPLSRRDFDRISEFDIDAGGPVKFRD